MESAFSWICPACGHIQNDSVNSEDGPFINLTCSECDGTFEPSALSETSRDAWEAAIDEVA